MPMRGLVKQGECCRICQRLHTLNSTQEIYSRCDPNVITGLGSKLFKAKPWVLSVHPNLAHLVVSYPLARTSLKAKQTRLSLTLPFVPIFLHFRARLGGEYGRSRDGGIECLPGDVVGALFSWGKDALLVARGPQEVPFKAVEGGRMGRWRLWVRQTQVRVSQQHHQRL